MDIPEPSAAKVSLMYDPDLLQPRSRIAAFWHCIRFQDQPTPRPNVRKESAKTQRPLPSRRQGPLCSMSGRSKCERQGSVHRKNSRPFAAQTRMRTHLKKQSNQNGKPPPTQRHYAFTPEFNAFCTAFKITLLLFVAPVTVSTFNDCADLTSFTMLSAFFPLSFL